MADADDFFGLIFGIHFFVSFKVGIFFLIFAVVQWTQLRDYSSLPASLPLPPAVWTSQEMMLIASVLIIAHIILGLCCFGYYSGSVSRRRGRSLLFVQGLWDIGMSAVIIAAVCLQHVTYLPRTVAGCWPYSGPPAVMDMFTSQRPNDKDAASNSCQSWVVLWILGVVIVIIYLSTGITAVVQNSKVIMVTLFPVWSPFAGTFFALKYLFRGLGYVAKELCWPVVRPLWQPVLRPVLKLLLVVLSLPFRGVYYAIKYLCIGIDKAWQPVLRPLFRFVTAPLRGLWWTLKNCPPTLRYLSARYGKWKQHQKNLASRKNKLSHHDAVSSPLQNTGAVGTAANSVELTQVASSIRESAGEKHMHSVKTLGLGPSALEHLRLVTCQPGSKSSCWACGIQICRGCEASVQSAPPRTAEHLDLCEPRCSKCYFQHMCKRPQQWKMCGSHGWQRKKTELLGGLKVCPSCAARSRTQRQAARETMEADELEHLSRSNLTCGLCSRKLTDSGPRWWACQCGRECKSEYHPAWAREAQRSCIL